MKRYDNGELITKERMQDEEWYSDYQDLLEFAFGSADNVDALYVEYIEFHKKVFKEDLSDKDKERILRWCVILVERHTSQRKKV